MHFGIALSNDLRICFVISLHHFWFAADFGIRVMFDKEQRFVNTLVIRCFHTHSRPSSLQATRAVTKVDGLPRAPNDSYSLSSS